MTYLIDTDWAADYLKGKPSAVAKIDPLYPDGLAISIITYAELYEGIYYGTNRLYYESGLRRFLRGIDVLNLNRAIARRFAILRGQLRAEGQLTPQPDLLIAATALHHNLTLLTRNERHFGRVPGLVLGY